MKKFFKATGGIFLFCLGFGAVGGIELGTLDIGAGFLLIAASAVGLWGLYHSE